MANSNFDLPKVLENIKKIKEFVDAVEKIGGRMPGLKDAIGKVEKAIQVGADISAAVEETRQALDAYTRNLYQSCELGDPNLKYVCTSQIDRLYQARSVKWTLDWKKSDSVTRLSLRNILCRFMPEKLSKNLQYCRR